MTEKRFVADNEYVMQNGEVYVVCGGEHSADVVATALNEVLTANEQLKKALWEAKTEYIEEKNEFSIDIERDMEFLKEEFERGYWND